MILSDTLYTGLVLDFSILLYPKKCLLGIEENVTFKPVFNDVLGERKSISQRIAGGLVITTQNWKIEQAVPKTFATQCAKTRNIVQKFICC